jgi:general secretion pathway protein G
VNHNLRAGRAGHRRRSDRQAGFTFIEIMVAMMILLILMGVAGFTYIRYVSRARVVAAKNQIEGFSVALNSYFLDTGRYPTAEQGLAALWEKPVLEPIPSGWSGPYMSKAIPKDPWGHDYQYEAPGPHGLPFGIRSLGADGLEGGEGNDKDVISWGE